MSIPAFDPAAAPPIAFLTAEYQDRWTRARLLMAEAHIDALLVGTEANYVYFTGHDTPAWALKSRPLLFMLPQDRDPVILTTLVDEASSLSAVRDIRGYSGFEPAATKALAEVIVDLGLSAGRIGCELGLEQRLGIPHTEFESLHARLDRVDLVDASSLFWHLRVRKSVTEVSCLRRAGELHGAAYRTLLPQVVPGISERELSTQFVSTLIKSGSTAGRYVLMQSGPGNYRKVCAWPTDRVLAPGDLWFMDAGSTFQGYWADYGRTVAIGEPSVQQRTTYQLAYSAMRAALARVRAGAPISEVRRASDYILAEAGVPSLKHSRIGHGLGLDLTEPPSVLEDNDLALEAGMVLALEPRIDTDFGHFQTEENIVVTATGYEFLSAPQSPELPVRSAA